MKNIQLKKHMMTAIAYLIPFVSSAGMLMVIGNIFGGNVVEILNSSTKIPDLLTTLGATSLGFIPVIISTGIAYSIADKPGIAPGVVLGLLCKSNGYGFLGGLVSGFLVGFLTVYLLNIIKVPKWIQGLLPQLILPLLVALFISTAMQYIIGIPIIMLTDFITELLTKMQSNPSTAILFGCIVGILSAVDYGGPINKVVFTFAAGLLSVGIGGPIANLIQASMIAPFGLSIGYILSKVLKKDIFSQTEAEALKSAFVMGCFQITEGSFPIILNDLVRITICTALGAGVSGGLVEFFGVSSSVPSGGFLAIPGLNKPLYWLLSLFIGSCVFAIFLQFLKRKPSDISNVDNNDNINLDELTFSEF